MSSPIKEQPTYDFKTFGDTWDYVARGLDAVFSGQEGITREKYMGMVTAIINLCSHSELSAATYQYSDVHGSSRSNEAKLYSALVAYLRAYLSRIRSNLAGTSEMTFLTFYSREWDRFTQSARIVNNIFNYINRHYISRERDQGDRSIYPVYHVALIQWYNVVFCGLDGTSQLPMNIIKLINQERDGLPVDSFTIKKAIESLITLSVDAIDYTRRNLHLYSTRFLQQFLRATHEYYVIESTEFLLRNSVVDYVDKATARLEQEEGRGLLYLHASSLQDHANSYRAAIIGTQLATLQHTFGQMLRDENERYLLRIFQVINLFPESMHTVRTDFGLHIQQQGMQTLASLAVADRDVDASQYVDAIADLHDKFRNIVENCLSGDKTFQAVMDKAFVTFVNRNEAAGASSKSAELVAKYADNLLKKTIKPSNALDADAAINKVILVFAYLEDKDVFQKFYTKGLARRLIHGTSVSDEAEGQMISRLKTACGTEYTTSMTRMVSDILVSKDMTSSFQEHVALSGQTNKQLDFTPLLLSHNVWPLNPAKTDFKSPQDLRKLEEQFKVFYLSKFNGRKILWLHNHSRNEIRMTYTPVKHILSTSTFQASILLQFNESDSLSYEDIEVGTGLSSEVLQPNLSLLLKQKILLKEDDDTYELNRKFKNPKVRININVPIKAEVHSDNARIMEQTTEDRKIEIQLVLVRIMKARKTLTQSLLINEAIDHLSKRFIPEVNDIKRQIDWLIDNEYLERGENRGILNYLA